MNTPMILRLNKSGRPLDWISPQIAACLTVKGQVAWSMGNTAVTLRGGFNGAGIQSSLTLPQIIAAEGRYHYKRFVPTLVNYLLFRRDGYRCMYCGKDFLSRDLSRDHIIPKASGGPDVWTNVVTACKRCNHRKGARTPEQANMVLLAIPYEPNQFEFLYLSNKRVLADQMEFLGTGFSNRCRPKIGSQITINTEC